MAYKFVEGKTIYSPFEDRYVPITLYKEPGEKRMRTDSVKRAIDKAFEIGLANQFRYFMIIAGSDVTISLCDSLACRHAGKPGNSMNRRGAGFLITFVGIDIQ